MFRKKQSCGRSFNFSWGGCVEISEGMTFALLQGSVAVGCKRITWGRCGPWISIRCSSGFRSGRTAGAAWGGAVLKRSELDCRYLLFDGGYMVVKVFKSWCFFVCGRILKSSKGVYTRVPEVVRVVCAWFSDRDCALHREWVGCCFCRDHGGSLAILNYGNTTYYN